MELEPEDENCGLLLIRLLLETGSIDTARRRYRKLRRDLKATNSVALLHPDVRREVNQWFSSASRKGVSIRPSVVGCGSIDANADQSSSDTHAVFWQEAELAAIDRLLSNPEVRIVTLFGPAGAGKTRLALEAASRTRSLQVCLAPLYEIENAYLIGDKILQSLRRPRAGILSPLDQAVAELERLPRPVLLILDNLEHLLEQAETRLTIATLLQRLPNLKCLVTSRQTIEVPGESVVSVGPLPVLLSEVAVTPESLGQSASAMLFVDRLQTVRADFRVSQRNANSVAALCRKLDGLPLALEIAATWARTLTPAEIVTHLGTAERRRSLLTSRQTPDNARHASLQRAIEWSYDRLPAEARPFFARLHIFQGSFTEEAAADVCEEPRAMDLLALLEERSLLIAFESDEKTRYRLLSTLREFGREQLDAPEQTRLARRHALYYLNFAEEPADGGVSGSERNEQLESEIDNLRAALATCLRLAAGDEPEELLPRMVLALKWFWILRGHRREGQRWMQSAVDQFPSVSDALLPTAEAPDPRRLSLHASVLQGWASTLENQRESTRVYDLHKAAYDLYRRAGNAKEEAQALNFLGSISLQSGRYKQAHDWMRASLSLSMSRNDTQNTALALHYLGMIHDQWCEYDEAERLFGEAAALYGSQKNAAVSTSQAVTAWHRGDLERAHALFLEARSLRQKDGYVSAESFCQTALANIASMRGDHADALALHQGAVGMIDENEEPRAFAMAVGYRGVAFLRAGDYPNAEADLTHALRLRRDVADRWGIAHALEHQGDLLCVARADWPGAIVLWAEAAAIRADLGSPVPPVERPWRDAYQAEARQALGDETFDALWRAARVR